MPVGTTTADSILGVAKGTNFTAPAELYIAPFNGDPTSGGSEVTNAITGSTSRIDADMSTFTAPATSGSNRVIENATEISITASASGSATFDYVALYTVQTGGTLTDPFAYAALTTSKSITAGDEVKFEAGALKFTSAIS